MTEAEQKALEKGTTQEDLIRSVAKGIFHHSAFMHLLAARSQNPILLLVGRGLNGLDCLALGCELLRHGYKVAACQLTDRTTTALSCLFFDEFSLLGGSLIQVERIPQKEWGIVIDGLLGMGAKRKQDKDLFALIQMANSIKAPLVSIDLPSGIDPETGEVLGEAIFAEYTFACQAPKVGVFFQKAWEHVGALYAVDIGLSDCASGMSFLEREDGAACLPTLERTTYKYRRGTVHLIAGSREMMGAAALAAQAAFTSGAGYVRSYLPSDAYEASLLLPLESVRSFYNRQEPTFPIFEKGALVVGPGLGKGEGTEKLLETILTQNTLPIVLDGDGLSSLPFRCFSSLKNAILTPHRREAETLLGISCKELSQSVIDTLRARTQELNIFLILKGSPTVIFFPSGEVEFMGLGTPAMATAGSGDVLSGILGSLLSQGTSRQDACRLGTILHALAGEQAALEKTSYSVHASHLIDYLPSAFKKLLEIRGIDFQTYLPKRIMSQPTY